MEKCRAGGYKILLARKIALGLGKTSMFLPQHSHTYSEHACPLHLSAPTLGAGLQGGLLPAHSPPLPCPCLPTYRLIQPP